MLPRFALARLKARKVLLGARTPGPPVDVEEIARSLDILIHREPCPGQEKALSGFTHRLPNGRTVIGVNSLDPPARQRFTIAHELGHHLMHQDKDLHVDQSFSISFRSPASSLAEDRQEMEANKFAAELLIPSHWLSREVDKMPEGISLDDGIEQLARIFGVSRQAMTVRLSSLRFLSGA